MRDIQSGGDIDLVFEREQTEDEPGFLIWLGGIGHREHGTPLGIVLRSVAVKYDWVGLWKRLCVLISPACACKRGARQILQHEEVVCAMRYWSASLRTPVS